MKKLAKMDESDKFGDIAGIDRNLAHVNSIDYNPSDDSIIISSRHQSAVVKIGRDKKNKMDLKKRGGAHKGWNKEFQKFYCSLQIKMAKKIVCDDDYSKCPVIKMKMVDLISLGHSIHAGELIVNQTSVIFI